MSDLRQLFAEAADDMPVPTVGARAERAIARARRQRKTRASAVVAAAFVAVVTGALAVPVVSRIGTLEPVSPNELPGLPDRVYDIPLHAPSVGVEDPLGQPAAYLLGGVARADGWFGRSCCQLAVVGASSDAYAFLELPDLVAASDDNALHVRLSPDGRTVAYPNDRGVGLLDLVDGTDSVLEAPAGVRVGSVLSWSADGTRLAVLADDGALPHLATVAVADESQWTVPDLDLGSGEPVPGVALAPDGSQVAIAQDRSVAVAPVDGGAGRVVLTGVIQGVSKVAWSPDGAVVVAAWRNATDGSRTAERYGAAAVELATGHSERLDETDTSFIGPILGFAVPWQQLLAIDDTDEDTNLRSVERIDLVSNRIVEVSRLAGDLDPALVDVAVQLDGPRESSPPSDPSRWAGAVAGAGGLIAIAVILTIGYRFRRP